MIRRTLALALLLFPLPATAKPVTWVDGQQITLMNDQDMNAAHYMYTVTPKTSVQASMAHMRGDDTNIGSVQMNHLVKRWNLPGAQANIYGSLGAGYAWNEDDHAPAGLVGVLADYETRRVFVAYEAEGIAAGDVTNQLWHRARVGFAPYEGEYDDLHTWIMLQTDYRPNAEHEVSVMPLIRLFKTDWMVEGGMNTRGEAMFNFIIQY